MTHPITAVGPGPQRTHMNISECLQDWGGKAEWSFSGLTDDLCLLGSKSYAILALKCLHTSFSKAAIWAVCPEEMSQVSLG